MMSKITTLLLLGVVAFATAECDPSIKGDCVEDGEEDLKQFAGGAFRPFFRRPFPYSTNHYPSGDTVPDAMSARSVGDKWLSAQNSRIVDNNRKADRFLNQFAKTGTARFIENGESDSLRDADDKIDNSGLMGATGFENLVDFFTAKYPDARTSYGWTYTEKSFTAKSDGFIQEYVYHQNWESITDAVTGEVTIEDLSVSDYTADNVAGRGTWVVTTNLYGKIISVRSYEVPAM